MSGRDPIPSGPDSTVDMANPAMSGRDQILRAVCEAIGVRDTPEGAPDQPLIRSYNHHADAGLDLFIDRLHHYEAATHVVTEPELAATIQATCANRGVSRIVVPAGIPADWVGGLEPLTDDPPLTPAQLDAADGVISTCAVAIAQTGTVVLDGTSGMGRRALSLVPDYHLCIVRDEQIVGSVPEAIAVLEPTRPLTFISGPSATVDIELVRIGGVHGPRTLEVIIVRSPGAA